jgi:hypothetical protein
MVPVPGKPDVVIAILDIAMMTFGGEARQRTEAEYNELFAATGFTSARAVGTGTAFSVLEVRPVSGGVRPRYHCREWNAGRSPSEQLITFEMTFSSNPRWKPVACRRSARWPSGNRDPDPDLVPHPPRPRGPPREKRRSSAGEVDDAERKQQAGANGPRAARCSSSHSTGTVGRRHRRRRAGVDGARLMALIDGMSTGSPETCVAVSVLAAELASSTSRRRRRPPSVGHHVHPDDVRRAPAQRVLDLPDQRLHGAPPRPSSMSTRARTRT